MNPAVAEFFTIVLYILLAAVIVRALLSWFPNAANNEFGRLIFRITEPMLAPVRRIMPRTGMIDFSSMVVIILLWLMITVVAQVR
ncbi:YggT family protein, partial [bacterium]|nr:YggT family protein [bacterium]